MKFGGTSVGDVAAFERVVHVVSSQIDRHPVVVTSAMTKVTDALLAAFELAKKGEAEEAFGHLEPHFERHLDVAEQFLPVTGNNPFLTEYSYAREELQELLTRASRRSL